MKHHRGNGKKSKGDISYPPKYHPTYNAKTAKKNPTRYSQRQNIKIAIIFELKNIHWDETSYNISVVSK